jgi:hypothetical protein
MPVVKLSKDDWATAWRLLIQEGGTTRISKEHIYLVSERQMLLLQEKQLPFEVLHDKDSDTVRNLSSATA